MSNRDFILAHRARQEGKTLFVVEMLLTFESADKHLFHLEGSLPAGHPRREEVNQLRRNLAGIITRIEKDFPPATPPGNSNPQ